MQEFVGHLSLASPGDWIRRVVSDEADSLVTGGANVPPFVL